METVPTMHESEQVYYVTDGLLAALAETLSRTSPPLLTLDVSRAAEGQVLRGIVALTVTGQTVLAAQLDRVATCGIDRWWAECICRAAVSFDDGMIRVSA